MPFRIVQEPEVEKEEVPTGQFRIVERPQTKEEKVAKSFRAFGFQPSPETIRKIRHPVGVATKGFAKGLLGAPGELINLAQLLAGVKEPKTILPTTEHIGSMFEKLSGEEFNPENLTEEFAEKGSEFLGSILGLGGPLEGTTAAKSFGRTILAAFAPAGVSLTAEKLELPVWAQVAATLGTSFLTHRLTGKGLKDIKNNLYSQADSLAGDAKVSGVSLEKNLKGLTQRMMKGGLEASDKEALRKIKDIKSFTKKGQLKVNDAMALKRKINEARGTLFAKDLGKTGVKSAQRNLNDVSRALDKTIGTFKNPEFQTAYNQANQIHGGIAESRKMVNFLTSHPQLSGLSTIALKYLFPSIISKGTTFVAGAQVGNFISALLKFPGYRKAYFEVLKNAAKEEIRGTATALKKFNRKTEELPSEFDFRKES